MTEASRLAALPGYDTAPDVYETPDLTDDTSTTSTTLPASPRQASETDETSDEEGDDSEEETYIGVSRRRLYPERARSRFAHASGRQEIRGADLSDRIDGRRKGLKVGKVRERGDEGEEGLESRIARLRREVEECRAEVERERGDAGEGEDAEADDAEGKDREEIDGLSTLLASLEVPTRTRRKGERQLTAEDGQPAPPSHEQNQPPHDDQASNKIADFDTRLAALEHALGISSLDNASTQAMPAPVLPSLTLLDQQLTTLTSATSLTHLEAASDRIAKLKREAESLSASARAPATAETDGEDGAPTSPPLDEDDIKKLQQLYTLLPTLTSLSPTVPALLARLRSLRTLHARAASAATELSDLEQRQDSMDSELAAWKEGLAKVEAAVMEADEANGRNGRVVEGWVRDLEGRMKSLGR